MLSLEYAVSKFITQQEHDGNISRRSNIHTDPYSLRSVKDSRTVRVQFHFYSNSISDLGQGT